MLFAQIARTHHVALPKRTVEGIETMNSGQEVNRDPAYKVVVNHEEQYSIWPVTMANPPGWKAVGKKGTKDDCLAYIDQVWSDMRPLSLRKEMDRADDDI